MNLKINRKGKLEKSQICGNYTTLLNNQWLKEELKREIRIYLETNKRKHNIPKMGYNRSSSERKVYSTIHLHCKKEEVSQTTT